MFGKDASEKRRIRHATSLCEFLRKKLNTPISMRLWDGSVHALGEQVEPGVEIVINSPGVIGSLIRRPTAENLLRAYATGGIDYSGADMVSFVQKARVRNSRKRTRGIPWSLAARIVSAFVLAKDDAVAEDHSYAGDESGLKREQKENKDFIQFHYDVSNDFYKLFLDEQMVYSCAYFHNWNDTLEQAQFNKLDMVCRKLQLKPGERMLDIGCGWGAMVCHAARYYGVKAHGITLSQEQLALTRRKIQDLGLQDQVTVELVDYMDVQGTFDKISSIGMVEHVGIDNMAGYMQKVNSLLRDRGLFLNHGITRPGKMSEKAFRHVNAERRLLAKYIFPGGELDHLGHMTQCLEASGFDVQDVEGWRDHYALTCRHWCERLEANREQAERLVGKEKYRLWVLYLAGCSFALGDGGARIYQTVSTKQGSRGLSGMPCTREHLYRMPTAQTAALVPADSLAMRPAA